MAAPSFYSDPHVQFLSKLLEEIGEGHLQVPRFQRPLVWNWERRRELLRSIRDGIPIGAIMVWRTSGDAIECYNHLGPHLLVKPPEHSPRQYLLDGVQRLSTLYGALHAAPKGEVKSIDDESNETIEDSEETDALPESKNFEVFYDLEAKDFVTKDEDEADLLRLWMPLNIVFDSVALLRFQRSLNGQRAEAAVAASDEIARAFRDYKVPIIPITTDDLDMATRTFQRINSQGARMSEVHMVHALTWSNQFDLRKHIADIRRDVLTVRGWSDLDDDPILKACKAFFDLDIYRATAPDLSDKLRDYPKAVDEVGAALGRAADFLWKECGVRSPDLVPYSLQIVLLAEAFRVRPNADPLHKQRLSAWFWMTTYGELFTGMSGDRAQLAITDVRSMSTEERPIWTWSRPFVERPLRTAFDFRTARAKALAFRLAQRQDETLGNHVGTKLLAEAGKKSVVQILPWSSGRRELYASPANRFLIHPLEIPRFRDALLAGALSGEQYEAHFITPESAAMLKEKNYLGFVSARLASIERFEEAFIRPLVELFEPGYSKRVSGT